MELVLCTPRPLETAVSILSVWYWKIIENPDKMIWFSAKKVLLSPGIYCCTKPGVRKLVGTSLEAKCMCKPGGACTCSPNANCASDAIQVQIMHGEAKATQKC